jgi:hypothetical protein
MTLKQFFELLIGIGLAIFFYNLNLLFPIKFVLIIFSVMIGFGLAFMPIEERPLDHWVIAFLKSIYRPTHFIWKKHPHTPAFLTYTPQPDSHPTDSQEIMEAIIQRKRAGLSSYLQTLPQNHLLTNLEQQERGHLSHISQLFTGDLSYQSVEPPKPQTSLNISYTAPDPVIHVPQSQTATKLKIAPQLGGVEQKRAVAIEKSFEKTKSHATSSQTVIETTPQPVSDTKAKTKKSETIIAQTTTNLPFPSTPSTPNTIVGMVLTPDNKIIENAIIEIRDNSQTPVRATKTNKLGQFFSTTPLKNGVYEIEVEKEGVGFDILKLELKGDIIDPLKIQAK